MALSSQEYLKDILVGQLNAGLWLLGFNHTFGKGGQVRRNTAEPIDK